MRESFLEDCPETEPASVAKRQADAATKIRQSQQFKRFRAAFRAECERNNAPCFFCGRAINYRLRHGPARFELHHPTPVGADLSRIMDPKNRAASHGLCNRAGGACSAQALGLEPDGGAGVPTRPPGTPADVEYSPNLGWPSERW